MIVGTTGGGDDGVLEVVKAEDVEDAMAYIQHRYPVAADLFNAVDQLPKSEFVLMRELVTGCLPCAGWVRLGR